MGCVDCTTGCGTIVVETVAVVETMSTAVVAEDEVGVMTVSVTLFPRFVEDEEAKPGDASLKMGVTTGGSGVTGGELSGTEIGTGEDRVGVSKGKDDSKISTCREA